jgi:hypothetical protein
MFGEGALRIGTSIEMQEDIYSLTFLSQLRTDIITRTIYFATGELISEKKARLAKKAEQREQRLKLKGSIQDEDKNSDASDDSSDQNDESHLLQDEEAKKF